jgi:hypothetical protein
MESDKENPTETDLRKRLKKRKGKESNFFLQLALARVT